MVDVCEPYTYSVITEASLTPSGLSPGRPGGSAELVLTARTCGGARPAPLTIQLDAIVGASGSPSRVDAGGDGAVVYPLTSVAWGSLEESSGRAMIPNPIDLRVPPSTDILLRVTPRIGTCEGAAITFPYRTGAAFRP